VIALRAAALATLSAGAIDECCQGSSAGSGNNGAGLFTGVTGPLGGVGGGVGSVGPVGGVGGAAGIPFGGFAGGSTPFGGVGGGYGSTGCGRVTP
jgi:hypothetical protein